MPKGVYIESPTATSITVIGDDASGLPSANNSYAPPISKSSYKGLSGGVIAGIVIASLALLVMTSLIIYACVRLSRRRQVRRQEQLDDNHESGREKIYSSRTPALTDTSLSLSSDIRTPASSRLDLPIGFGRAKSGRSKDVIQHPAAAILSPEGRTLASKADGAVSAPLQRNGSPPPRPPRPENKFALAYQADLEQVDSSSSSSGHSDESSSLPPLPSLASHPFTRPRRNSNYASSLGSYCSFAESITSPSSSSDHTSSLHAPASIHSSCSASTHSGSPLRPPPRPRVHKVKGLKGVH